MPRCARISKEGVRCGYIAKNGQALAAHLKIHNRSRLRGVEERLALVEVKLGIRKSVSPPTVNADEEISIEED